ncbi:MAG: L,D-transpeptidase [Silvanigrellaceae bacterium]|nr:L,D-transpeptidase [Silvanigrellaceae bacterium]
MFLGKLFCLNHLKYRVLICLLLIYPMSLMTFSQSYGDELKRVIMPSIEKFRGIPSAFIGLGNYHPTYGIIVEKDYHRLTIFQLMKDGNYEVVKTYPAVTGKMPGEKVFRGDNRTPVGIYFTVGETSGESLLKKWGDYAKKYGVHAFFLDYPNIYDKRTRKTGSGIWIHGVESDTRLLTPQDTEGCVALRNPDVLELKKFIKPFHTPVVIVDKMETTTPEVILSQRSKALEMINSWKESWQLSDFKSYMSYYSKDFMSLGLNRDQWQNFKSYLSKVRNKKIEVLISEPKIVAFRNQLLVVFLQSYSASDKKDFGRKFLYLQQESDSYKIIAEKWYSVNSTPDLIATLLPNDSKFNDTPSPMTQTSSRLVAQNEVQNMPKSTDAVIEVVKIPEVNNENSLSQAHMQAPSKELERQKEVLLLPPQIKLLGDVKFENLSLTPYAKNKTRMFFHLKKRDEHDVEKTPGHICAIVKTQERQFNFPKTAKLIEEGTKLSCVSGDFAKFARLRPTEMIFPEDFKQIKQITLVFTPLVKPTEANVNSNQTLAENQHLSSSKEKEPPQASSSYDPSIVVDLEDNQSDSVNLISRDDNDENTKESSSSSSSSGSLSTHVAQESTQRYPEVKFIGEAKFDNLSVTSLENNKIRIFFNLKKSNQSDHRKMPGHICVIGKKNDERLLYPENAKVVAKGNKVFCSAGEYARFSHLRPTAFILPKKYSELDEIVVIFTPIKK